MTNNQIIDAAQAIRVALIFGDTAEALRLATELAEAVEASREDEFIDWCLHHPEDADAIAEVKA